MMTLYHGTERDKGKKIIVSQNFNRSLGDEHWLGDGIYFYGESCYAFRWIYLDYIRKYPHCTPKIQNVINKYVVLSADITIEINRIFDLSNVIHKILFDEVYKRV